MFRGAKSRNGRSISYWKIKKYKLQIFLKILVSVPSADRLIPPLGTILIDFQTVTRWVNEDCRVSCLCRVNCDWICVPEVDLLKIGRIPRPTGFASAGWFRQRHYLGYLLIHKKCEHLIKSARIPLWGISWISYLARLSLTEFTLQKGG
jgi:hypothetical protein